MALEPKRHSFAVTESPVERVVVYQDRAEVTRKLEFGLEVGINEIVVEKLSSAIEKDSVR